MPSRTRVVQPGQEVQRGQRLEVGVVALEGSHPVGGVRIEGRDLVGDDDMVADPDVVEGQVLGALGEAAQIVGRGHGPPAGQRASKGDGHGVASVVVCGIGSGSAG